MDYEILDINTSEDTFKRKYQTKPSKENFSDKQEYKKKTKLKKQRRYHKSDPLLF